MFLSISHNVLIQAWKNIQMYIPSYWFKSCLRGLKFFNLMPVSVMQWRMEIGYFSKFSIKHLQVIKANALTLISIHYFKSFLISFLSFYFYYIAMKFIMMIFNIPIYTIFESRVLFDDISFIIRHYFSYIFSIIVVHLLYS